jgi:pyruvate/2-oxoglutarate dehydrogenase complex dihydrolipoamide dehydrogenase (E3) component
MHTSLINGVNKKDKGIEIQIKNSKGKETLKTDVVLVSIGRKPYTKGL